jgi:tetrahydromethanopterin S-methyltransferase subunit G
MAASLIILVIVVAGIVTGVYICESFNYLKNINKNLSEINKYLQSSDMQNIQVRLENIDKGINNIRYK